MTLTRKTPLSRTPMPPRSRPMAKLGKQKAKRQAKNAAYYRSAEWRDVKKRTHEHDGYQCTKIRRVVFVDETTREMVGEGGCWRCPNVGEVVNGKQTAKGLVCDELTYRPRGDGSKGSGTHEPGVTCRTLCAACNALETVSKRANHMQGFNNGRRSAAPQRGMT